MQAYSHFKEPGLKLQLSRVNIIELLSLVVLQVIDCRTITSPHPMPLLQELVQELTHMSLHSLLAQLQIGNLILKLTPKSHILVLLPLTGIQQDLLPKFAQPQQSLDQILDKLIKEHLPH